VSGDSESRLRGKDVSFAFPLQGMKQINAGTAQFLSGKLNTVILFI
jgi:hypothetical protein